MKKILLVANKGSYVVSLRKELIEELLEIGYDVTLAYPLDDTVDLFTNIGCNFIDAPLKGRGKNIFDELKVFRNYKKIIQEVQPDIILTYTIKPNLYIPILAKKLNIPVLPNITGLGTALEYKSILQKVLILFYRFSMKKVPYIFFQNNMNKEFFEKNNISKDKQGIILPGSGVNLTKFNLQPYPEQKIINFVFIGRGRRDKGLSSYIELAEKYTNENIKFHIFGSLDKEYQNTVPENKNVIYHGTTTDIPKVLKNIHCLIHPSYYPEGMANVLLEAAATGKVVITTSRAGCVETVEDKVTGYIIDKSDPLSLQKITEKFLSLTQTEKSRMGLLGRQKMEKEFDRNIVIKNYLRIIRKVLEK